MDVAAINPRLNSKLLRYSIAVLSGIWLFVLTPPGDYPWSAWFAYVPLFYLFITSPPRDVVRYALIFGFIGNAFIFSWLAKTITVFSEIHPFIAILAVILHSLYLTIPLIIFALVTHYSFKLPGRYWLLVVPATQVLLEFVFYFITLFPYNHAMSQHGVLPLMQIVSVTGIWGLTYFIFLTNCALTLAIYNWIQFRKLTTIIVPFFLVIALTSLYFWGANRESNIEKFYQDADTLNVLQMQQSVSTINWAKSIKNSKIRNELSSRWFKATMEQTVPVDWIIWPESSSFMRSTKPLFRLQQLAIAKQTNLTFGAIYSEMKNGELIQFNSVFTMSANGEIQGRYDKQILVPGTEFYPWESWLRMKPSIFTAGTKAKTWLINGVVVATPICYEAIFYETYNRNADADLMVNLTNDIWFAESDGMFLHAMLSQFKSIEFGVPVLRIAYTGYSYLALPSGKILFPLPVNQQMARVITIPYGRFNTVFNRWGHWFVWFSLAIVLLGISRYIKQHKRAGRLTNPY